MRTNPFDFWFDAVADDWFTRLRGELNARNAVLEDVASFAKLSTTETLFGELSPTPLLETDPSVAEHYLALLFAACLYWENGRNLIQVERAKLELLLAEEPDTPSPVPPGAYVQLPEQMFWARVSETEPHEPLDGFIISLLPGDAVFLLAILGFREERDGVSQLQLRASLDELSGVRSERAETQFEPAMAGGSEARFHSVVSERELLCLARLALRASVD